MLYVIFFFFFQGIPVDDFEELSDDECSIIDNKSVIPPALALLMNATKFFHDAPGSTFFYK